MKKITGGPWLGGNTSLPRMVMPEPPSYTRLQRVVLWLAWKVGLEFICHSCGKRDRLNAAIHSAYDEAKDKFFKDHCR